ncbi:uncharacterized protein N7484_010872 [Penicillium longicatenatum]|uniref:uncharacterized protein n=1 Tax=Penicillium longicatenatum TaxID=1561947 RepID=UPI002548F7C2|nr:uncharacterized protein N7484_010872 [Penicillium longicatenatum]KAJ5630772.1 hypothetical protein N7484_010872 [Penicillium longicatenatum]
MSSGFVSAGTTDQPVERDDEWLKVQQELEEERRKKAEIGKQNDGKSLFEVLQQNKMAKQEQFEEKIRLKNQFRSLDEDEVEFLDSVLESTRAQEAAVKKDTADQLEAFRKQREEAEKTALGPTSSEVTPAEEEEWTIPARKRRREKKDLLLPGKKRKESTEGEATKEQETKPSQGTAPVTKAQEETIPPTAQISKASAPSIAKTASAGTDKSTTEKVQPVKPAPSLGLVGYGSDSDSE